MTREAIFTSKASIFLPKYSGVRPDHEPCHKDGDNHEHKHAVQTGACSAEDDLTELHQPKRHEAAQRRKRIEHGVDAPVGGRRCDSGPKDGIRNPEPHILALHVPPGLEGTGGLIDVHLLKGRIARLLTEQANAGQWDQDCHHGGKQRPSLPPVAEHSAEGDAKRRRDQKDGDHFHKVRQRSRVLQGMGPSSC